VPSRALIELARPAVAVAAPEELPLLESTVDALTARRGWRRHRASRSEDMLGFGWDGAVPVVTVAAVGAAQAALAFLAGQAVEVVREEASGALRERLRGALRALVRRLRRRPDEAPPPAARAGEGAAPLTAGQLREVRRVALDRALGAGLDRDRAELVADAIVGRLATPDPSPG